jgi:hypothetical protein
MVSVLAPSAIDRGFEPWSGQTKDYKFGICYFSAKQAALRRRGEHANHYATDPVSVFRKDIHNLSGDMHVQI